MTAREAYARIAYEDDVMQSLGYVQDRVWQANALDTPNVKNVFLVVKSQGISKAFGATGADTVEYWVHRPRTLSRDYWPIDEAIDRLKFLLTTATHVAGSDGWVLTAATWVDTSRDLTDDTFNTLVKYVTFRAAVRNMVTP